MNKKSIMFSFFLRLLIALIIFIPTVYFFSSLFRLSESALDNYNNLAEKVKEIAEIPGEYKESVVLRLDKDTAVLGFKKDSNELFFYGVGGRKKAGQQPIDFTNPLPHIPPGSKFIKPNECEEDKACMCLCQEVNTDKTPKEPIECNRRICNSYDNINFISEKSKYLFAREKEIGGFIIERFSLLYREERLKSVYIHKYEDFISICLEQPCITDEMKDELENE